MTSAPLPSIWWYIPANLPDCVSNISDAVYVDAVVATGTNVSQYLNFCGDEYACVSGRCLCHGRDPAAYCTRDHYEALHVGDPSWFIVAILVRHILSLEIFLIVRR